MARLIRRLKSFGFMKKRSAQGPIDGTLPCRYGDCIELIGAKIDGEMHRFFL